MYYAESADYDRARDIMIIIHYNYKLYVLVFIAVSIAAYNLLFTFYIDSINMAKRGPLHLACKNGHYQTVETLLNHEYDVNETDDEGFTPLNVCMQIWPH